MLHSAKNIAKLQFITSDDCQYSHLEQLKIVLENGVNWVQLRAKNIDEKAFLKLAEQAKKITESFSAVLIINDHVTIAQTIGAEGVHIGKEDLSAALARKELGAKIIGGTANTLDDILIIEPHVDYVGLGPFRFTSTKKKLSPVLGREGYLNILKQVPHHLPVIGIGGVLVDDVNDLLSAGLHGIAVSGAIINDENPEKKIKQFLKAIETYAYSTI
ncbi:MAG: thiamine phosphate synthase [Bacteroidetes bacterium]|nr:thiamine phosphate synthase [Bacteroidota bacterium]